MIPKAKLKKLRNELKGRSMKYVAEKTGKSENAVWDVLRGKYQNMDIISACIEYRDLIKEESKLLTDRI